MRRDGTDYASAVRRPPPHAWSRPRETPRRAEGRPMAWSASHLRRNLGDHEAFDRRHRQRHRARHGQIGDLSVAHLGRGVVHLHREARLRVRASPFRPVAGVLPLYQGCSGWGRNCSGGTPWPQVSRSRSSDARSLRPALCPRTRSRRREERSAGGGVRGGFSVRVFFQALYSEAIFLSAPLPRSRRGTQTLLLAGVLAGTAMLARAAGIAVLAGLLVFAMKSSNRRANVLRLATALPVFSIYLLVLAYRDEARRHS